MRRLAGFAAARRRRRRGAGQGAARQGRQPGDGAGRGRAARLAAGAVPGPRPRSTRTTCGCSTPRCARSWPARVRVGVASHNLFDVALARWSWPAPAGSADGSTSRCSRGWRRRRPARCGATPARCCCTPRSCARATSTSRSPTWSAGWRRTPAEQNFLHALFGGGGLDGQEQRFRASVRDRALIPSGAAAHPGPGPATDRRAAAGLRQQPPTPTRPLPANAAWAATARSTPRAAVPPPAGR